VEVQYVRSDPEWNRLAKGEYPEEIDPLTFVGVCVMGLLITAAGTAASYYGYDMEVVEGRHVVKRFGKIVKVLGRGEPK
jgi:hypothetical protein